MNTMSPEERKMLARGQAAADIIENGDMAVLMKLVDFQVAIDDMRIELEREIDNFNERVGELETEHLKPHEEMVAKSEEALNLVKDIDNNVQDLINEARNATSAELKNISAIFRKEIEAIRKTIPKLPAPIELRPIFDRIAEIEDKIPEILPPVNVEASEIRSKLESLKGDDRLDKSAIKGLEEEFERIRSLVTSRPSSPVRGIPRINTPIVDDLSERTDGSTKVFELSTAPRNQRTIKVWGSDFPIILRYLVDFTVTGKILTLTDAVPAPSQGATLIIEYYV